MRKIKKILFLLVVLCIVFTVDRVEAINKDIIDNDDSLNIPMFIASTGSKITVYDTTDYELYGQWMEITVQQYQTILEKSDECDDIYDEYIDFSSENRPSVDDYETNEEYNEAATSYNAAISEYKARYDACATEYYNLVPNFDDAKWEKLTDDTVYLPEESFSGTKPFILFIKLDDKQNSIIDYEFAILKLDGELPEVDNTNWKKLKAGIKENKTITTFNNDEYTVSFDDNDENIFIIKIAAKDNSATYTFTLKYNNGIVTYNFPTDKSEGYEFVNSIVIGTVILEVADIYGYNQESFLKWLEENEGKLTLDGNGITYVRKEYNYESKSEGLDFSLSGEYFESLSVNIAHPIIGYTEKESDDSEQKEEVPPTGDLDLVVFAMATLACASLAVVAYRKTRIN